MKLTKVTITKFQSILDSNELRIGDITCLVGKNEAGKTAILKALYRLNPIIEPEGKFDLTHDYPRMEVEDYKHAVESGKIRPAQVVTASFTLEDDDLRMIHEQLGADVVISTELTLFKGYDSKLTFSLDTDLERALNNLLTADRLPPDTRDSLSNASTVDAALDILNAQQNPDRETQSLKETFTQIQAKNLDGYIFDKFLASRVPAFLYFDEYYRMKGQENIEALLHRQNSNTLRPSDYPMIALIELARLEPRELVDPDRTQDLKNKLEGAGNHLSKQILKYWSQNKHLDIRFDVRPARPGDPDGMKTGTNIWADIYDSRNKVTTSAGIRSRGFVSFFSFLAWYSQIKAKNQRLILLLDEPGLSLHAKAQEDLLHYFEEEVKGVHQLIYTTHSPFMIDPQHFERIRIVQDKGIDATGPLPPEQEGTKILTDISEATEDSLFPLQGALGYQMRQALFPGLNSLIVEGVSDLLYLQIISAMLQKQGRTGLSPEWTITPVGGGDKIPTFVSLVGVHQGIRLATLIGIEKKDEHTINNLYKSQLLKKSHVLAFRDFTDRPESDIEDMFDEIFFISLLNEEFKADLQRPLTVVQLNNNSPRINVRLDAYFQANPMKNSVSYSHYRLARYFAEKAASLESRISNNTFERFEAAFKALNALI